MITGVVIDIHYETDDKCEVVITSTEHEMRCRTRVGKPNLHTTNYVDPAKQAPKEKKK